MEFLFVRHLEKCRRLQEGVEIRSDGVHRIHRTRIDSIGLVEVLFVRHLENCRRPQEGVESRSDGHVEFLFVKHLEKCRRPQQWVESRFDGVHRTGIQSIGRGEFLLERHLEKCYQAVDGVVSPSEEPIRSMEHEYMSSEMQSFCS